VGDRYVMQLQTIGPDTNRVELQTLHDRMIGSTVIP